jgi:hypothetical protein
MTKETFKVKVKFARRWPDPNYQKPYGLEHHLFLVSVADVPPDFPMEANARRPNTNKQVYREVRKSLRNESGEPGTFHLKNKGIVLIAESVTQSSTASDVYNVVVDRTAQGILDGGHTYELIQQEKAVGGLLDDQYVFIQVRTSVPHGWVADISRGLNTSVQVQDMSLDHLKGLFAWIKEDLKGKDYFTRIAWSENDEGDYDARDIVALMFMMNIGLFATSDSHPIAGYEKKSDALRAFENDDSTFRNLRPVLKDILFLHDWMAYTAADFYNKGAADAGQKGRGRALSFVKQANRKQFCFPFLGPDIVGDSRLEDAALYPLLAAFRVFLKVDPHTGNYVWIGGFNGVKKAWADVAYELIKATHHTAAEVGRSNNAIGKSRLHWDGVYQKVENYKLRQLQAASEAAGA